MQAIASDSVQYKYALLEQRRIVHMNISNVTHCLPNSERIVQSHVRAEDVDGVAGRPVGIDEKVILQDDHEQVLRVYPVLASPTKSISYSFYQDKARALRLCVAAFKKI